MVLPASAGYVLAVGSALCNGSWPAIVKAPRVVDAKLAPLLLNFFFICGFGLVGAGVVAATREFQWTAWGLLSGAMLTSASCLTLGVAIPNCGVAVPSGVSCACYLVAAYVWSAYILDQGMRSVELSLVGVFVVIGGLGLVVAASAFVLPALPDCTPAPDEVPMAEKPLVERPAGLREGDAPPPPPPSYGAGLLASAVVGLLGGSNLAPENFARTGAQGIDYIPSYAAGAVLCSACVALAAHGPRRLASANRAILPGVLCGVVYGGGICCVLEAMAALDYAVASTLSQLSMLVTGAWGVFLYGELDGDRRRLATYFAGAAVIAGGAGIVSYYGTTK